jgi:hypothetical protein
MWWYAYGWGWWIAFLAVLILAVIWLTAALAWQR